MSEIELDAYAWRGLEYLESVSGAGAIAEMVEDFVKDAPGRLVRMKAALEAGERQSLSRLAHDLKSNSATLGVLQLSVLAAKVESTAGEGLEGHPALVLKEIESLLPRVLAVLEERVKQYPV
jgi:HPt (histidine-containing phosphotransfer) domain-containing protein